MGEAGSTVTILGLSDKVDPLEESPQIAENFAQVDLILACGGLPADYLAYALAALNRLQMYIPRNLDQHVFNVPGGDLIDGRLRVRCGLFMLGFGGSLRHKTESRYQSTQEELRARFTPFLPRLVLRRLTRGAGLYLLVGHAPPFGIHDLEGHAYQGFIILREMIWFLRPRFMLHGHTHAHANISMAETPYSGCRVFNVFSGPSMSHADVPDRLVSQEWVELCVE